MSTAHDTGGTGRVGVLAVGLLVEKKLKWAFREQPVNDFGIDAHAESKTPDGKLSGRLLALQIKGGPSYFKEETKGGYVFRGDAVHLAYWSRHSLPVIVILHHPDTDETLWQVISTETVESTGKGWKIVVPRSHIVDQQANAAWEPLAEGTPYQRRLLALVLAKPWMHLIAEENKRLFLEFDEWINKSSGRGTMRLLACDEEGDEEVVVDWRDVAFPGQAYQDVIHHVFPWAEFSIDEDFYEPYDAGPHIADTGHFDGGELVMTSMSLTEWRKRQARIRPYDILGGEVAHFRLELTINRLGRSFLRLDRYLESGEVEVDEASRRMSLSYGSGLKNLTQRLRPQVSDTPKEDGEE